MNVYKHTYTALVLQRMRQWRTDTGLFYSFHTPGADFTKGLKLSPFIGQVRDLNLRLWS